MQSNLKISIKQIITQDFHLQCLHSDEERKEHEQFLWSAHNHALYNVTYIMEHTHQLNAAIAFMQALTTSLRVMPTDWVCISMPENLWLRTQSISLSLFQNYIK